MQPTDQPSRAHRLVPAVLLTGYVALFIWGAINPYDRATWWVENTPIVGVVTALVVLYVRGVRFSPLAYVLMAVLPYWHTVGGHYTFERVPFGWFDRMFGFKRNMFDRIGHFSVGFFAFGILEYLLSRRAMSRPLACLFAVFAIAFVAMSYELMEWLYAAYGGNSAAGANFLGSQGDVWDAQKDMLMDTLGAIAAVLLFLALRSGADERRRRDTLAATFTLLALLAAPARAQRPPLSVGTKAFVAIDTPVVALTHARVIDGTGASARDDQTLIIRDGVIAALGDSRSVAIPAGAQVVDLTGKAVIPGLVMVHEHLFYPTGPGVYANLAESFTRLYLAGGVTSMRTGGNMNGFGDIGIKRDIEAGKKPGPWLDATAPYLEGPGLGLDQVHELTGPDDARRMVNFWADAGATSFKAYMHITRAELGAAIEEAHKRGLKVTGHLCSVTYREAATLGIDDLEHGFFASTDFVTDKKPDECPGQGAGQTSLAAVNANGETVRSLIADLVRRHVALTSTLTIFETFVPGRALPPGLDVLEPQLRAQFEQRHATTASNTRSPYGTLFAKAGAMELAFARAGGLLLVGTDPTGGGGVIPGYSNQHALELLVQSGFTPLEAIRIGTLNGATFLGRADRVGSIALGKQADLVVVSGDPSTRIGDVRNVQLVFKQGVGYDPAKLIESVKGKVGLF